MLHAAAGKQIFGQGSQTAWEPFSCLLDYGHVALYPVRFSYF